MAVDNLGEESETDAPDDNHNELPDRWTHASTEVDTNRRRPSPGLHPVVQDREL